MKTIDCTPTWSGLLPMLLTLVSNPKNKGNVSDELRDEFRKMAEAADKWNKYEKAQQKDKPRSINYIVYNTETFEIIFTSEHYRSDIQYCIKSNPLAKWINVTHRITQDILDKINKVNNTNYQ